MNFKEYIEHDIKTTFINGDEFAEEKSINGVKLSVVEDSDKLEYRIKKNYDGLLIGDVLFYISAEDWGKIPRVGAIPSVNMAINYDGKASTVINVNKQSGLYEIILRWVGGY